MEKRFTNRLFLLPLFLLLVLFASTAEAYSISGNVSYSNYSGMSGKRIYLTVQTSKGTLGTSIPGPGPYTIRGVPSDTSSGLVYAFLDVQNTGSRHASDPSGVSPPFSSTSVTTDGIVNLNFALGNPSPTLTPMAPDSIAIFPGPGTALIMWDNKISSQGITAESYTVYWSTSPNPGPTDSSSNKITVKARNKENHVVITGLADGTQIYFAVTATIGSFEATGSNTKSATIGAPTGGAAVSGNVALPAPGPTGSKVYVAACQENKNGPPTNCFIAAPSSAAGTSIPFSISSVPNGTYSIYGILDQSGKGDIDALGNLMADDYRVPVINVSGTPVTGVNVNLTNDPAFASVSTSHWKDSMGETYGVNLNLRKAAKRPVTVTLTGAPSASGIPVPMDLGVGKEGEFDSWVSLGTTVPTPGTDVYTFTTTYSDGTASDSSSPLTAAVTAVLPFATPSSPVGPASYSATPSFSWAAPSPMPTQNTPIRYEVGVSDNTGKNLWSSPPINGTSANYNSDGTGTALTDNASYSWNITAFDARGNSSSQPASFTFGTPPAPALSISTTYLPSATSGVSYSAQLQANGGTPPYSWSYTGTLPTGISLDSKTGTLSGTPSGRSYNSINFTVTDSASVTNSVALSLNVMQPPSSSVSITTPSPLPAATAGSAYSTTIYAEGGVSPYTFSIASGSPPSGISLSPSGHISGTTNATGTFTFTIQASDSSSTPLTQSAPFSLTVNAAGSTSTTITYIGKVVDGSQNTLTPMSGVQVAVVAPSLTTPITTTTDQNGSFKLEGIPSGTTFGIRFVQTGYADSYSSDLSPSGSVDQSNLPYMMFTTSMLTTSGNNPGNAVIRGRIVDSANQDNGFISGAVVSAVDANNSSTTYPVAYVNGTALVFGSNASTGVNGAFVVLNVPANGAVNITASKNGYSFSTSKTFHTFADSVTQGRLSGKQPTGVISLTAGVVDSASNPVAGATVQQVGHSSVATTTTITDGSFTLPGLPSGTPFAIKISQTGFADTYSSDHNESMNVIAGRPFAMFTPSQISAWGTTPGNGAIRGSVADAASTDPSAGLAGVGITATNAADQTTTYQVTYGSGSTGATATGSDGLFTVANVPDGISVVVSATMSGYSFPAKNFTVHAGAVTEGRIIASSSTGTTVTGACGSANGQSFTTAPSTNLCKSGTASTVTGTGPWSWSCNGSSPSSSASCSAAVATSGTGGSGTTAGGSVSGTVTYNGAGAPGILVSAFDTATTSQVASTSTDPSGNYHLQVPAGNYTIRFGSGGTANGEQWYNNKSSRELADVVAVASGASITGINAAVTLSGSTSGTGGTGTSSSPITVSGTVSYTGSKQGRIYIIAETSSGRFGTSITAPGSFTIRGIPQTNYMLSAFMDYQGIGMQTLGSPAGVAAQTTSASNIIVLTDPTPPSAIPAPTGIQVFPGDASALVAWDRDKEQLPADSYDIYWGTSSSVSPSAYEFKQTGMPPVKDTPIILPGLTNGASYYFVVVPNSGGVQGTPSDPIGPVAIGAVTGGHTVSGSVDFTGITPSGKLYVAVVSKPGDTIRFTSIANPVSPQQFSVTGVPDGAYNVYAVLDQNADNRIGIGDIINPDASAPAVTLQGADVNDVSVALAQANAVASITTHHGINSTSSTSGTNDWYDVNYSIKGEMKLPVAVTYNDPVAGAIDLGLNDNGFEGWSHSSARPTVGASYTVHVTYADGTGEYLTGKISAVLDSFATILQAGGADLTVPTFTWGAPATAPNSFQYRVQVYGYNYGTIWETMVPSNVYTAPYAGPQLFAGNTYRWSVTVEDPQGNSSSVESTLAPQGGTVNGQVTDAGSIGLGGVIVTAVSADTSSTFRRSVTTNQSGNYTITLPAGSFKIRFDDAPAYITQWYNGKSDVGSADAVTVTAGNTMQLNTTVLLTGGRITGRVSDANGIGMAGVSIGASDASGVVIAGARTDDGGNYTIQGLATGSYQIQASGNGLKLSYPSAVPVTAGSTTSGINFAVSLSSISGSVTSTTGQGGMVDVVVEDATTGNKVNAISAPVNGGSYTVAVPPGTYKVHFDAGNYSYAGLMSQWYNNKADAASADAVTVTAGTATTGVNAVLAPTPPAAISGTVSYSGTKTGRIYLTINTNNGTLGTSIAAPGPYSIRGVPAGNWTVMAFMDAAGIGRLSASSPVGFSQSVTVNGAAVTGADVALNDSTYDGPPAAPKFNVVPGAGSALIASDSSHDGRAVTVDTYDVYWGTSATFDQSSAIGKRLGIPANTDTPAVLTGLQDGSTLYFKVIPKLGTAVGSISAPVGPITIGAATGGNTVSGSVNFTGITPSGPLYVAVVDASSKNSGIYYTSIAAPVSPQSFSVTGVPAGVYNVYAVLDQNYDNLIGQGDIMTGDDQAPLITVDGSDVGSLAIKLSQSNAVANVSTSHETYQMTSAAGSTAVNSDWYGVNFGVRGQTKQPVKVTLVQAPANLTVPVDLGLSGQEFHSWTGGQSKPKVGDSYGFQVTYADGTTDTLTAAVTAVLDGFATNPQVVSPVSTVPSFSWGAPANAPAAYRYELQVNGSSSPSSGGSNTIWDVSLPSTRLSAVYGGDQPLQIGSYYNWRLAVRDTNGNEASTSGYFNPTVDQTLPVITATPDPGVLYNGTLNVSLAATKWANIYYTLDGTTPTTSSTVYSAPISIAATTTVNVIAVDIAGNTGKGSFTYNIDSVVPVTTATPAGGEYTVAQRVTLASSKPNVIIYYTLDGSDPTTSSHTYNGHPILIGATSTLKFFAKDLAGNIENIRSETYTIDTTVSLTAASPPGGIYSAPQTVTLVNNKNGTIYYTLDGTTPTTASTVYSGPITVSATATIKCFAVSGTDVEPVRSYSYTILTAAPVTTAAPAGGKYNVPQSVALASSNPNATIFYTLTSMDGKQIASGIYQQPIMVMGSGILSFYSKDLAGNVEKPQAAAYLIDTSLPFTTATPPGGLYNSAQSVTLSSKEGATIYYTVDGTIPTKSSTVYGAPIQISQNTVLMYFSVDQFGNVEMPKGGKYAIDTVVPVTTANPAPGQFTTPQQVTLSASKPAIIYFTLDGSTPTQSSPVYAGPIVIGASTTVTFFARDAAGNSETPKSASYVINTASAVTSAFPAGGTYNGPQSVTLVNSKGGTIYYTTDGSIPTTATTGASTTVYSAPIAITQSTVVKFFSKDAAGTLEPLKTQTYTITSATPPVTTASLKAGSYNSTQSVALSVNRTAKIFYTTDGTTPTTLSGVYTAPIAVNATMTLQFFAMDAAGNKESVHSLTYTIDTVPPVTSASPVGGIYNSAQTVTLAVNKDGAAIYYTTDGSAPTTASNLYGAPITVSASTMIRFFAKDAAGNLEAVKTQTYVIDGVKPKTTASPDSGVYNHAINVTLSTSKTGAVIYYTTDGSAPTTASTLYTGPIPVTNVATITFFAKDAAGNVESPSSASYTIDTNSALTFASPVGGLYNAAQSVTLSNSKGAEIYYTTDGSTPTTTASGSTQHYTGPVTVASSLTLKYLSKDAAGNVEAVKSQTYVIDGVVPVTTSFPAAGTFNTAQTVTLSANKPGTIYYSTDPSAALLQFTAYSGPISIGATTTLRFYTKDVAGNVEAVKTQIYTIDTTAPVTTPSTAGGLFTAGDNLAVKLSANKAGAVIYYTTDGTIPTTASTVYSAPIPMSATTTLKYFAKDAAGNFEDVKTQTYTLLDLVLAQRALNIAVGRTDSTDADYALVDVAPLVNGKPNPDRSIDVGDVVVLLGRMVNSVTW